MSGVLRLAVFLGFLGIGGTGWSASLEASPVGDDVVAAFARAARGEPLRYVAIGGSITQASGPGWIGDWLKGEFPQSEVAVVNSGMSATGSALGIFRIERDVIAHQPDLVAIEYCVNDGGLTDDEVIRYMETLIVRLKSLPHPPAIVIVEAAARGGVNLARHRQVARHYGLVEVDMQAAVDARLAERGEEWSVLFGDSVHPNAEGHAFYAETMRGVLAPFVVRARESEAREMSLQALPEPMSKLPLLLDARMVPLQGVVASGWKTESSLPHWWSRFFQGVLSSEEPGVALRLPVRGTTFGIFYAMSKDYGTFYANVNNGVPRHIRTNTRGGYSFAILETDLPAREHGINFVLPEKSETDSTLNGPVKLGYLLIAGESQASREPSPQGKFDTDVLRNLVFVNVSASSWRWTGPFLVPDFNGKLPLDARSGLYTKSLPEPGDADFDKEEVEWKTASGEGGTVDVRQISGSDAPAVVYARTGYDAGEGGEAILSVTVDYYAQLWLNGERILVFDGPHPRPYFLTAQLKPGENEFFIKTAAGSGGHSFELSVAMLPEVADKSNPTQTNKKL